MRNYLPILLALLSNSAFATCAMSEADLKGLAGKPVVEAEALAPAQGCSFVLNQLFEDEGRLSLRPPIREGQPWSNDTVIVNARRVQVRPGDGPVMLVVAEALVHRCPDGKADCPVHVPFRKGRQFFGDYYRIEAQDKTLHDTLVRVAKQDGRRLLWEAGPSLLKDTPIKSIRYFRPDALGVAVTSDGALEKILRWHEQWRQDHPGEAPFTPAYIQTRFG